MRQSFGPTDFFALEAGDCLDRLERLLARPEGVPGEEFVRQVRLLRGAALMAHLQPVAQAGAAFEALARAVREGAHPWDAATREAALGAVDDFRGLVRRAGSWGAEDDARARRLAGQLADVAGRAPGPTAPAAATDAAVGVRVFVAREGARLAEGLGDAAAVFVEASSPRALLENVLARLQPLRGLAGLSELGAVADLLDGIELTLTELRQAPPTAEGAALLDAAARALADAAAGRTAAPTVHVFARALLARLATAADVIPIEALFADGDAAPYVTLAGGHQPVPRTLGAVELVSQGEHLVQVADRLADARDDAERDLRLAGLFGTLHALHAAAAGMPGIAAFARETLVRLAGGEPARDAGAFVTHLRRAADLLRRAGEAPEALPTSAWDSLRRGPRMVAPEPAVPERRDAVPIAALVTTPEADVVPIESLLQDDAQDESAVVPIAALGPDAAPMRTAFERSVAAYFAGARTGPPAAVVAIDALLYRGTAAQSRAVELRAEVTRRLRDGHDWADLRPIIEEILDLLPLALDHA